MSSRDSDGSESEFHMPTVVGSLVAGVFFGGVGGGVAFPTLPTLGTVLGLSPLLVGVILSINRFTRLLMNTPAGGYIDKVGTRKPMIVGFIFQGVPPFGYIVGLHADMIPLFGPASIFIAARIVWGLGSAFVFVGAFSTVVHVTSDNNRGKWIGYFRGGQSLGFPSGLIAGGILTDLYGYEVAFGIAGTLGLLAAGVSAVVLPDVSPSFTQPTRFRDVPGIVLSDSRIFMIGSINFTVRFLFHGVLLSTIVVFATVNEITIGEFSAIGVSGVIMGFSVIFSSTTTAVTGSLSDRVRNRLYITVPSLAAITAGFVILSAIPTLEGTLTGLAVIGIGIGGTSPPLLALLGDLSPAGDTGKLGGVYNMFGDLGMTLGPLVALPVAERVGYAMEYLLCAGMVGIVLCVLVTTMLLPASDVEAD
ncbi:MFS transporter [Halobellus salinisoli]|uniref:MFS transporter n=1 Tax=Halobellus salinisoli TaxID=3108500 RepID=UPI00300A108B